ncbi:hypothetical protein ACEUC3_14035 [Aeromonas bivalvium]|uniref:Uncharacterized protein n=1 Tax=Aeromonas bivalvium TaxID=440079 RepID=A0ABW9GS88_9GAMM
MPRLLLLTLLLSPLTHAASPPPREDQCRQAFLQWMLDQQQVFSDRKASKQDRRQAERAIDLVRAEYEKEESFCQSMALARQKLGADPRFKPRRGEIHDFTPDQG